MRRRTYDVLGRAEGRRLLERRGTHSDLAPAFLWSARTICISQGTLCHFFFDPAQPAPLLAARLCTLEAASARSKPAHLDGLISSRRHFEHVRGKPKRPFERYGQPFTAHALTCMPVAVQPLPALSARQRWWPDCAPACCMYLAGDPMTGMASKSTCRVVLAPSTASNQTFAAGEQQKRRDANRAGGAIWVVSSDS